MLRKQLELLRVNEFALIPDDQKYDDSVAPDSQASETDVIGEQNATSKSVRHEQESKITTLQSEIGDLKAEMEQSKRLAKYDKDDMARVNRSLREELEAIHEDKTALEKDLNEKCEEFDTLTGRCREIRRNLRHTTQATRDGGKSHQKAPGRK